MKILAITTIRSDYDLMSSLYRLLHDDSDLDFKLLVAGAHMSPTYGKTVESVERDGFGILLKAETLFDSDSYVARLKSAGILLTSVIDAVSFYSPDLIIYAGDREDVMVGALLGGYLHIPTIHFFGGDHAKDGHIDNPLRHATTKLSTYHFVSTDEHAQRIIALGEPKERIKNIGSVALDKFVHHNAISKAEVFSVLAEGIEVSDYALVIFHPVEEEIGTVAKHVEDIITSLRSFGLQVFLGSPNTDPGNRSVVDLKDRYKNDENVHFYGNLDRDLFLSLFKQARLIVGNSSAGLLEAASIPIPAVNVGQRQVGRMAGDNVIFTDVSPASILKAIEKALTNEFVEGIEGMVNPYGDGRSSNRAYQLIKQLDFQHLLYKKEDPLDSRLGE